MDFVNRIASVACFDREAYTDIVRDEKATGAALKVVALAGWACSLGSRKVDPVGWFADIVFVFTVFFAATVAALVAAYKYDPDAWQWGGLKRAVRALGFSTAPGIAGAAGLIFGPKIVAVAWIWCAVSYVHALRHAFDYKPVGARGPIGVAVVLCGAVAAWAFGGAIRGGVEFLGLLLILTAGLFHKGIARWFFGHGASGGAAARKKPGFWGGLGRQLGETRALLQGKGWDVTLRELVETFTLIQTRAREAEAAASPPLSEEKPDDENVGAKRDPAPGRGDGSGKEDGETPKETPPIVPPPLPKSDEGQETDEDGTGKRQSTAKAPETAVAPEPEEEWEQDAEDVPAPEPESDQVEPAETSEGPGESPLTVARVCGRVFDENISGYESSAVFREEFKGRSVSWRGRLKQAEEFSYDSVFGSEPGAKALLEIAELATGYGKLPVEAVVRLPVEELSVARERIGGESAFVGELVESDPYARRVFVKGRLAG